MQAGACDHNDDLGCSLSRTRFLQKLTRCERARNGISFSDRMTALQATHMPVILSLAAIFPDFQLPFGVGPLKIRCSKSGD